MSVGARVVDAYVRQETAHDQRLNAQSPQQQIEVRREKAAVPALDDPIFAVDRPKLFDDLDVVRPLQAMNAFGAVELPSKVDAFPAMHLLRLNDGDAGLSRGGEQLGDAGYGSVR